MRADTFEKRVNEVVATVGMSANQLSMDVDLVGKRVTIGFGNGNTFTVAGNDLAEVYKKAIRVLKSYVGIARSSKPKAAKTSA